MSVRLHGADAILQHHRHAATATAERGPSLLSVQLNTRSAARTRAHATLIHRLA